MDVKSFNLRRAEEERQKAAAAESEDARKGHDELARIFASRAAERRGEGETPPS